MILIFSTFPNKEEAVKIGRELLKKKLIACYNLFPVESSYWWKDKIVNENEILMIMKIRKENFKRVEKFILKNHSYETPEVVAVKPNKVTRKYLNWIKSI